MICYKSSGGESSGTGNNSNAKWHSKGGNKKNKADVNNIDTELNSLKITSKSTTKLPDKKSSFQNNANNGMGNSNESGGHIPRQQQQHQQHQLRKKKSTNANNKEQQRQQQKTREILNDDSVAAVEQSGNDGMMVLDANVDINTNVTDGPSSSSNDAPPLIDEKAKIIEKKCRNVAKKLQDIQKLKARQQQGETLQLNQLQKIAAEPKLMEELRNLEKLS